MLPQPRRRFVRYDALLDLDLLLQAASRVLPALVQLRRPSEKTIRCDMMRLQLDEISTGNVYDNRLRTYLDLTRPVRIKSDTGRSLA